MVSGAGDEVAMGALGGRLRSYVVGHDVAVARPYAEVEGHGLVLGVVSGADCLHDGDTGGDLEKVGFLGGWHTHGDFVVPSNDCMTEFFEDPVATPVELAGGLYVASLNEPIRVVRVADVAGLVVHEVDPLTDEDGCSLFDLQAGRNE